MLQQVELMIANLQAELHAQGDAFQVFVPNPNGCSTSSDGLSLLFAG